MKIDVHKNFGLDGQDLQAGTTVIVNKGHFGDNLQAFLDEGYFVEHAAPPKEEGEEGQPVATALPEGSPRLDVTEHEASVPATEPDQEADHEATRPRRRAAKAPEPPQTPGKADADGHD